MRPPSKIDCDIPMTKALRELASEAGIEVDLMYWNGSIPSEVVLIVKGYPHATLAMTPAAAIKAAGERVYGGL